MGQWSALPGATAADRTRAFVTFGLGALVVLAASSEVREEAAVLRRDCRASLLEVVVVVDPAFPRCDHLQEFGPAFVGRRARPRAAASRTVFEPQRAAAGSAAAAAAPGAAPAPASRTAAAAAGSASTAARRTVSVAPA